MLGQAVHRTGLLAARRGGVVGALQLVQRAGMKVVYGEKYPYAEPYDYKGRPWTIFHEWFDESHKRINENSKFIVVDGPIASGKNDMAQKLAKEFDLKYIPSICEQDLFVSPRGGGWDYRDLNDILPASCKFYDLELFYKDTKVAKEGRIGKLQYVMYIAKFFAYCEGLEHILSTGQGCVMAGSPHSDLVYLEALYRCGYISRAFFDFYSEQYRNSICEAWCPHLTVYLDLPAEDVMKRIKERGDPREQDSPVLTIDYVQEMEKAFKTKYLPLQKQKGHVMEIDQTKPMDKVELDGVVYEMSILRMESQDNEDPYFQDWTFCAHNPLHEDIQCAFRRYFGNKRTLMCKYFAPIHHSCTELITTNEDYNDFRKIIKNHPGILFEPGYNPANADLGGFFLKPDKAFLERFYLSIWSKKN